MKGFAGFIKKSQKIVRAYLYILNAQPLWAFSKKAQPKTKGQGKGN
jgi:hypothetical protein